jgi:hypothetical protein
MARTSEGLSFVAADIEVSQDNSTWVDLADYGSNIAVSGGDRATGEVNVFSDERPIVKAGKKASQDLVLRYVYTEETSGPFATMRGWDDAVGGVIYVRYWPKSKASSNFCYSTGQAIITSFLDPQGEAGSGDPVLGEIGVKCEELSKTTWPTS